MKGLLGILLTAWLASPALTAQQPFRSGVDVVAVDVQVVDNQGNPLQNLEARNFQVSIQGRRRRIASVDLVRFDSPASAGGQPAATAAPRVVLSRSGGPARSEERRVYVLAVDTMSFRPAATRNLVAAAKQFVQSLLPTDIVAVIPFPMDGFTDLTTDHTAALATLDKVVGTRSPPDPCRLNPSDLIDFTSPRAPQPGSPQVPDPLIVRRLDEIIATSSVCERIETILASAKSLAMMEEVEIAQRLGSLRSMLQSLATSPARKTVVLLSTGIISADRTGGRPDIGIDIGSIVGQEAARANATIYTLWVDGLRRDASMADTSGKPRATDNYQRDAALVSAPLDRLTAASGGEMFNVIQGGGEFAFERILRETSAYYVLGVEPEDADRDGRPRQLEVRVSGLPRGASVRSRSWVVVPPRTQRPPDSPVAMSAPPAASPPPAAPAAPVAPAPSAPIAPAMPAPTAPSAPPAPIASDPALIPRLSSAASYVDRFTAAFGNVIAEERYVQDLLEGGRLMVRRPAESAGARHRELRSDLVLVQTGDALGWQMFRDVFEADGEPVRDRQERLSRLFEQPATEALAQAARIARESTRYNIGAVERTLNTPVLALLFLQADQQSRFQFSPTARTPGFSDRVDVIEFRELARPTIVRTVKDTDRPASGRFWIDRDTGAVLQTELVLTGEGVSIRFTTLFRHDDRLEVAVPVRMQEEYVLPSGKLVGTATYGSFRQFSVSTDTKVAAPGRAPQ